MTFHMDLDKRSSSPMYLRKTCRTAPFKHVKCQKTYNNYLIIINT